MDTVFFHTTSSKDRKLLEVVWKTIAHDINIKHFNVRLRLMKICYMHFTASEFVEC